MIQPAVDDVIDLFLTYSSERPSETAISLRGESWTYGELENRVRCLATTFSRASGPRVLIALPQGPDAYAAMLAAGMAGCFYAPLNIESPPEKQQRIARLLKPDIVVTDLSGAQLFDPVASDAMFVRIDTPLEAPLAGRGTRHETAYVIFTSGTTGIPKGAVIPRSALNHFVRWVHTSSTVVQSDRVPQFSNLAFDVSVTDIYGALCCGASLHPIVGRADRTFPARAVARERLTIWNSTPSVISLMMQAGETTPALLGSLRLVNMCGEPLFRHHLSALFAAIPGVIVQNSYGPTETTVTMTELRLDSSGYGDACESSVAIGSPIERMTLHLVGGSNVDEGEIVITGPQLASGYWNDPEKTEKAFRMIELDGSLKRAYFSGDWAERRRGHIFFKERLDHQVKIRGFRLELDEVARAFHDVGFPVTCVVKWKDQLTAVVELHPGQCLDELELRSKLARKLEAHAIPTLICLIEPMPRTPNDKLDRRAVLEWLDSVGLSDQN